MSGIRSGGRFTKREVARAVGGAIAAGATVERIEVNPISGSIILHLSGIDPSIATISTRGGRLAHKPNPKQEAAATQAAA